MHIQAVTKLNQLKIVHSGSAENPITFSWTGDLIASQIITFFHFYAIIGPFANGTDLQQRCVPYHFGSQQENFIS